MARLANARISRRRLLAGAAAAVCAPVALAALGSEPGAVRIDPRRLTLLDARRQPVTSRSLGINNRGQVVGEYVDADGTFHGFLWRRGRSTTVDVPGSAATSVTDINDEGHIVGVYADDPSVSSLRGFVLRGGRYTTFDPPGGTPLVYVNDINNRGQIVGTSIGDPADVSTYQGFLLGRGPKGPSTPIIPPGSPGSFAGGLNDRGQIVGTFATSPGGGSAPTRPMS